MAIRSEYLIGCVVLLAFVVRLAVLQLGWVPTAVYNDAVLYDEQARSLLAGGGIRFRGQPTALTVPGYPIFLAGVYSLFGQGPAPLGVIHAILGSLTAGAAAWIALRVGTLLASMVAGVLVALNPHLLLWTGLRLTETLFIALSIASVALLVEGQHRNDRRFFVAAGVTLACAVMTRSVVLPYVPIAAVLAAWLAVGRERWVRPALLILIVAAPIAVWVARNAAAVGVAALTTDSASVLWAGHNPDAAAWHRRGYVDTEPLPVPVDPNASEAERYRQKMGFVTRHLAAHPLSVLASIPAKLINMWRPVWAGSKARTWIAVGGSYVLLLLLSFIGVFDLVRRPHAAALYYVLAYIAVLFLVHALTIGEIRYRMPIEPALAVIAGIGAASLVRRSEAPSSVETP